MKKLLAFIALATGGSLLPIQSHANYYGDHYYHQGGRYYPNQYQYNYNQPYYDGSYQQSYSGQPYYYDGGYGYYDGGQAYGYNQGYAQPQYDRGNPCCCPAEGYYQDNRYMQGQYPQYSQGQYGQGQYGQYGPTMQERRAYIQERVQERRDQYNAPYMQDQRGSGYQGMSQSPGMNQPRGMNQSRNYSDSFRDNTNYDNRRNGNRQSDMDDNLENQIKNFITNSDRFDNVDVSIHDGNVTLSGSVLSQDDKNAVEQRVRNLPGVRNVTNKITVKNRNY